MMPHYWKYARLIFLCLLAVMASLSFLQPAGAEEVLYAKSTSGSKIRTLLTGNPETAKANVMLFTGGSGVLKISGKGEIKKPTRNFLVRTRQLFADAGFLAAVVDAPLDRRKPPGLLAGFRASPEHAKDLQRVAKRLQALNGKPVIAIGTSRGTVSAANLAVRDTGGFISAVVLTSSLAKQNKNGKALGSLPLDSLKVPVLFVHNKDDKCKLTLLADVKPIVNGLKKQGVKVDMIVVNSEKKAGNHCKGQSPHGFLGLEQQVIRTIIDWFVPLL